MAVRELKIGASGVRGVVGDALTPELIVNFACAFGTWCGVGPVVIGRDTRRSSTALRAAVVSGLLSTGCRVIDLGLSSSPLVSFAIRELGASGGIAVTGSHNDANWNALKFFGPDGALLNAAKNEELLDIYHGAAFDLATWDRLKPVETAPDVEKRYLEHLAGALDLDPIRARRFRVAVDFTNGACGPVASRFLESLHCTLLPVNAEPTGEFAHPPAPTAANMRQLATLARCFDADLGAALNVDGDRVGFVTAEGHALSEEYSLPLVATPRMRRRPGPVVTSHSTSGMVDAVARAYGQRVVRGPVGESHAVDLGLAEGAVIAGEGSGGMAVLPLDVAYDGLLALGLVLEEMATSGEEPGRDRRGLPDPLHAETGTALPSEPRLQGAGALPSPPRRGRPRLHRWRAPRLGRRLAPRARVGHRAAPADHRRGAGPRARRHARRRCHGLRAEDHVGARRELSRCRIPCP